MERLFLNKLAKGLDIIQPTMVLLVMANRATQIIDANRDNRARNIVDALVTMTWKLGYSKTDLKALAVAQPAVIESFITALSQTPIGTANKHWWRGSTAAASQTTVSLAIGILITGK